MKKALIGAALIGLFPFMLLAQTGDDALRAQIRADLMKDPRTAQMSSVEIDALVSGLADQAHKDGTADQYLESHTTFNYAALFPAPEQPGLIARTFSSPMVVALLSLLLVLCAVALYIFKRRGYPVEVSDIAA